ncbi:MAG TPA: tetratricopeptide repeat protein [Anaeromyxobacteraceae bacterium]|nr:tetratricopeptide repeat protein [Anaeromyxobacteraceae bacterium]
MRRWPRPLLALALLGPAAPAAAIPLALAQARREAAALAAAAAPEGTAPSVEGLRRYARAQTMARKLDAAVRTYQRILSLAPGDVDALSHLGQLLAWTADYDRAIVLYRDALARRPGDLGLQSDLADVLAWAKRLEEAERLYQQVLARSAGHHEALKGLAHVRLLRGDADGAAPVLDRALALYPDDVDLLRDRARMLSQKGDPDRAVEALQHAVRLAPSDPDVLRHLAETLQQKGDWEKAVDAWDRVARLDPDSPGSHVGLGRAYLALGRISPAREHAGLALRMSPTDAGAAQLVADLDREAGLAPVRTAAGWFEVLAYAALLPVVLLVARKTRRQLRRRPGAWVFAAWVLPALVVLNVLSHVARGFLWRRLDTGLFEAATEVVLFAGLAIAFVAVLRSGPPVREFAGQVVLALGAHPDDIELGCGGFLLKLKGSGARVYGLTFTRGERGTDRDGEREAEARRAAQFLGLDGHWVLDFPDTGLSERIPGMKAIIEERIRELGVTTVLTHTEVDVHGDHRAVFAATREAARAVPTVLCYEDVSTPGQFAPNYYVDITHYLDAHLKACALHRTQEHRSYMDPQVIQGRAAHRGMQVGVHFAMAFRTLNLVR